MLLISTLFLYLIFYVKSIDSQSDEYDQKFRGDMAATESQEENDSDYEDYY